MREKIKDKGRLGESLKEQHDLVHTDNLMESEEFVKTLSVHGEIPVPSDEKGLYALWNEKY